MFRKLVYITLIGGIVLCLLPLASVVLASGFASLNGCELHEGYVNPCVVFGIDRGDTLYSAALFGWFMMFTLPIAVILVLLLLAFSFGSLLLRVFKR